MSIVLECSVHNKSVCMSKSGKKMIKTVMNVCNAERGATFRAFFIRSKRRKLCCLAVMLHIVLSKIRVVTTKTRNQLLLWRLFSANHNQPHPSLYQKGQNLFPLWRNLVDSTLVDTVKRILFSIFLYQSNLQLSNMILSVYNDGY